MREWGLSLRRITIVLVGLLAGLWVAGSAAVSGAAGIHFDPGFGGGKGFVTTRIPGIPGTGAVAYGAITLPGGRIVVAGQVSPPSGNGQVVLARYLPNGRLDSSFASAGIFQSSFPVANAPFLATAIARDPETGKLVVAGGYGQGSMLVMRLTADGRLDPTFGPQRSGFATVSIGGIATALVIQRNGGILLGGTNANRPGRPFVVVRFHGTGTLDRGFGHRGVAQELFWNPSAASGASLSLATTGDGGVIAGGHIDYIGGNGGASGGHGTAGVFRLTRSGHLLQAFGTRGHLQVTFFARPHVPESWYPCAMAVDGRGRIMVTGGGGTHRNALFTARLTGGGILDPSYGAAKNGRAITPGVGGNAITTCGATSTRGGELTVAVQDRVAQLLPSGLPNQRFARGGVVKIRQPAQVFVNALIASGSRRFVMAGSAGNLIYVSRIAA